MRSINDEIAAMTIAVGQRRWWHCSKGRVVALRRRLLRGWRRSSNADGTAANRAEEVALPAGGGREGGDKADDGEGDAAE